MAHRSNNPLALAKRNVYGHMYCDELTRDSGNTRNSAQFKDSGIIPNFQIHFPNVVNGERRHNLKVVVSE